MAITGAWPASMHTCAGIIAGAAEQWDAASVHFAAAIAEADSMPIVTSQPAARTWLAEMLRRRDAPADRDRARALLGEAVSICERHGMVLMGRRAQAMLSSS
jgi:hypothetical protein